MQTILVTGVAGFIGMHLAKEILHSNNDTIQLVGIDNVNDYYSVALKQSRLAELNGYTNFHFHKGDISDVQFVNEIFTQYKPQYVIHLAAQAGVRHSITHPAIYINSNIVGFFNILEACRSMKSQFQFEHLIYASSSSIYGNNKKTPYSVDDKTDSPVSLYAATKKSNELMAYSYSELYDINCTGLRFFTVYGPWGRPDMAYYSFTEKMLNQNPIQLFNKGDMYRDFTYIDDIVKGIRKVLENTNVFCESSEKHRIFNIGNNKPEQLSYFVDTLEKLLIKHNMLKAPATREYLPMQPGDVYKTCADIAALQQITGFSPQTSLEEGLDNFVVWYKQFIK